MKRRSLLKAGLLTVFAPILAPLAKLVPWKPKVIFRWDAATVKIPDISGGYWFKGGGKVGEWSYVVDKTKEEQNESG